MSACSVPVSKLTNIINAKAGFFRLSSFLLGTQPIIMKFCIEVKRANGLLEEFQT